VTKYQFKEDLSMSLRTASLAACAATLFFSHVNAADFTYSGNIEFHNDVVRIDFELFSDAADVKVWTDSFASGANFDPITAVWSLPTGELVGQNDDNALIAPGQTYFDSGLVFPFLAAGKYAFTVTPFLNFAPANLFEPFPYSDQSPIPIGEWCQPASSNCENQKGTFWRVNFVGVDSTTPPIPEPSTAVLALFGLGLLGMAAARRCRD
jgi:hypothetical protein